MKTAASYLTGMAGLMLVVACGAGCSGPDGSTEDAGVGQQRDADGALDAGAADGAGRADAAGDAASEVGSDAGSEVRPVGEVVQTELGGLRGVRDGDIWAFKGVPFAKPPVGGRRWRAPSEVEAWKGTLDATQYGPMCPQTGTWGEKPPKCSGCSQGDAECRAYCQAEDCLYLNVWTPAGQTSDELPVMVWFHGGSYVSGAGSLYDGAELAERGNVVVVTVNYRLGPLGAMAHERLEEEACEGCGSANYGLWDQIEALWWVQEQIEAFGGDPERVTIFGESAGGSSVCQLVTSREAAGLFDRAIMQSGICASVMRPAGVQQQQCPGIGQTCPSLEEVRKKGLWDCIAMECVGELLVEATGCGGAEQPLACMREKEAQTVLEVLPNSRGFGESGMVYSRFVDGETIYQPPGIQLYAGTFQRVPFMMGTTADEMTLFFAPEGPDIETVEDYQSRLSEWGQCSDELAGAYPAETVQEARDAYLEMLADQWYTCTTNLSAKWASRMVDVWLYRFTHVPLAGQKELGEHGFKLGAYHSAELPYVFGEISHPEEAAGCEVEGDGAWRCCDEEGRCFEPRDRELSRVMMDYWTSFARDGTPGALEGMGRPAWPAFRPGLKHLPLKVPPRPGSRLKQEQCEVWEGVWGHVFQGTGYCY